MKRVAMIAVMVAIAVMVGVLVAWAASFPEGIHTSGIGIGSGPGGADHDALVFEDAESHLIFAGDNSYMDFRGDNSFLYFDDAFSYLFFAGPDSYLNFGGADSRLDFRGDNSAINFLGDNPAITFSGNSPRLDFNGTDSRIEFQHFSLTDRAEGGIDMFRAGEANGFGCMAGGTPEALGLPNDLNASYVMGLVSTGFLLFHGDGGLITSGKATLFPDTNIDGVTLSGFVFGNEEYDYTTSKVHVGPTGGLTAGEGEGEGEGEPEWAPSAEMALYVKPEPGSNCDDIQHPNLTASVSLKGNSTEGEIVLANYRQDTANSVNSSITISKSGDVIIRLGGPISNPAPLSQPIEGYGSNTEGLQSSVGGQSLARAAGNATETGPRPARPNSGVPNIRVQKFLNNILDD